MKKARFGAWGVVLALVLGLVAWATPPAWAVCRLDGRWVVEEVTGEEAQWQVAALVVPQGRGRTAVLELRPGRDAGPHAASSRVAGKLWVVGTPAECPGAQVRGSFWTPQAEQSWELSGRVSGPDRLDLTWIRNSPRAGVAQGGVVLRRRP
ncbi:MAG: hypothetical protein KQJ78_17385 [Deltaproteobacteria bacterium]|nr:hypothetical protein [Deltaproteobacteria bacterium]